MQYCGRCTDASVCLTPHSSLSHEEILKLLQSLTEAGPHFQPGESSPFLTDLEVLIFILAALH